MLVAVNSIFQIAAYSLLGWFYLDVLPGWLGLDSDGIDVTVWEIARSVLIFLGIPLVAGFVTRLVGEGRRGTEWYETRFLPRIGPLALYGLLVTIVILFALQGDQITDRPFERDADRPSATRVPSPSCGSVRSGPARESVSPTTATRRLPSLPPATISNWRSP